MVDSENRSPAYTPELAVNIAESVRLIFELAAAGRTAEDIGRDGFRVYPDDPLAPVHRQLNEYLNQIRDACGSRGIGSIQPRTFPMGASLLGQPDAEKLMTLRAIAVRILVHRRKQRERFGAGQRQTEQTRAMSRLFASAQAGAAAADRSAAPEQFSSLAAKLFAKDLPYTEADLASFIEITASQDANSYFPGLSNGIILRTVESYATDRPMSPFLRNQLEQWRHKLQNAGRPSSPGRKLLTRINALTGLGDKPGIEAGDAWSNAAISELNSMQREHRDRWCRLLQHCQKAETTKPTGKWMKTAKELLDSIGHGEFRTRAITWFDLVALPRPVHQEPLNRGVPDPDQLIADINSVILKGLVWCCVTWRDDELIRAVSRLAQTCFKKVQNLGSRCPRVGNACLYYLSMTATEAAAAELTRLNDVVKQPPAAKLAEPSLDTATKSGGQTHEDLEETTVPTYGLHINGHCKQTFGGYRAEFSIAGPEAFELLWRKPDGKMQKSVPADVKDTHGTELEAFRRTLQDIEKMVPAQRRRIERLLLMEREWDLETWRKRYLNHPLLADLTRRLIWHFKLGGRSVPGAWLNGKIVNVHDKALDWLAPETRVRLWHPIGSLDETIAAWRAWLQNHEVCQPFKQAHREIYVLTDAELQTGTYSNRFAAHFLRQHQFAALAKDRGWTYLLQGAFDSHNVPTLQLPHWNLTVEYWVDSEGTSQSGIYLHVATDQIRFIRDGEPLPLTQVPALVFSEAMRDVDLFVSIASIGSDPRWQDRGDLESGNPYWHKFAFGDLTASAKTRKEVLEKLLPKLKIAPQCSFDEKFLVVKGTLRTYKIHLGSGNIQMEPNNHYLCIVPNRRLVAKQIKKLFLPFEGDRILGVILSKAFLLADDSKIKDPTIVKQITGIKN